MSKMTAGYCRFCGMQLVRDAAPNSYDADTGEPLWTYSCPQARPGWSPDEDHDQMRAPRGAG